MIDWSIFSSNLVERGPAHSLLVAGLHSFEYWMAFALSVLTSSTALYIETKSPFRSDTFVKTLL